MCAEKKRGVEMTAEEREDTKEIGPKRVSCTTRNRTQSFSSSVSLLVALCLGSHQSEGGKLIP